MIVHSNTKVSIELTPNELKFLKIFMGGFSVSVFERTCNNLWLDRIERTFLTTEAHKDGDILKQIYTKLTGLCQEDSGEILFNESSSTSTKPTPAICAPVVVVKNSK